MTEPLKMHNHFRPTLYCFQFYPALSVFHIIIIILKTDSSKWCLFCLQAITVQETIDKGSIFNLQLGGEKRKSLNNPHKWRMSPKDIEPQCISVLFIAVIARGLTIDLCTLKKNMRWKNVMFCNSTFEYSSPQSNSIELHVMNNSAPTRQDCIS